MAEKTNQTTSPLQLDAGADLGTSCPNERMRWMKSHYRGRIASVMTAYLHEVQHDWKHDESIRFINAVEKLMFRGIDTDLLLKQRMFDDGVTFSFCVVENVNSDELFDQLLVYHSEKWRFIEEAFAVNGTVDLVYEDRFLNSPLGCFLLVQFIRRIQFLFHLNFRSIRIFLSKRDFHVMYDDDTLKLERKFSYPENRDKFLCQCMDKLIGQPFELLTGNTKHTRSLTLTNGEFELSIHPEGGISHGWGLTTSQENLTVEDILQRDDINLSCYNLLAHSYDRKGVPFMVEFKPVKKAESCEQNHDESSIS